MSIAPKTDYTAEAQADLVAPEPFGSAPKLMGLLAALTDRLQTIENDAISYVAQLAFDDINSISGVHLDRLGALIGQPRWDRDDAGYRLLLRCRIIANNSEGTPDAILSVASILLETLTIDYSDGPASFMLTFYPTTYTPDETIAALRALLLDMAPVGVSFEIFEAVDLAGIKDFLTDAAGFAQDVGQLTARSWRNG